MGRSLKKGPFVAAHLLEKVDKMNAGGGRKPIKTWARASMIIPDFVGHTFLVHNGKIFNSVFVTENMGRPQVGRVLADAHLQEARRAYRQGHQVNFYPINWFMRGSAWRLAAAVLGSVGVFSSVSANGQQGPSVRVALASNGQQKPSLSVTPTDPNNQSVNLKQQLKETQDRLHAFETENEALRRRNDSNKETIHTLTESLAVANAECEVFRRQSGELKLRMEALGLAAVGDNKEALEQRLLQAVRDLALVRDEKDVLAEHLVALSESVMLYLEDGH